MSVVEHARKELEREGLFESEYDGMLATSVMELIEVFSKQNHSNFSAELTIDLFTLLASHQPLSPLTNDPEEWEHHSEDNWQNKRNSKAFSKDQGKTYTVLEDISFDGTDWTPIVHTTQTIVSPFGPRPSLEN